MRVNLSTVLSLPDLATAADQWRAEGAVIVLASGCFDPLHVGHVQHLRHAKRLGNVLIVAVTGDAFVGKGPGRPRSPDVHRAEVIAALREVDAAVVNQGPNSVQIIDAVRPHVFVKGSEYLTNRTPQIIAETDAVEQYGGRVEFVTGPVVCSSTAILTGMVAL